jgi:hypothetical protein
MADRNDYLEAVVRNDRLELLRPEFEREAASAIVSPTVSFPTAATHEPECGATAHGPERCKGEPPASTAADAASRLRPGISMGTARRYCSYPTPCSKTRSRSSN